MKRLTIPSAGNGMPILEIQSLVKTFRAPDGEALRVIDIPYLALDEGEQAALEGSSGSGKTTLLNLVSGILAADGGVIRVAGQDLVGMTETERDRHRATHISYVFQTFNLLQGFTAFENVLLGMMFGPGPDPDLARSLLERVGLKDRMSYRPRQLSVGQQQRVALARALANRPRLVLADEPTGNLDRKNATEALDLIRSLCRESRSALLLVSHDRDVLGGFERVEDLARINRPEAAGAGAIP